VKTLVNATKTLPMRWLTLETRRLPCRRSEIAENLNVLHFFVKLIERWTSAGVKRHGVTAPLDKFWANQELVYNFRSETHGTGSRSEVVY